MDYPFLMGAHFLLSTLCSDSVRNPSTPCPRPDGLRRGVRTWSGFRAHSANAFAWMVTIGSPNRYIRGWSRDPLPEIGQVNPVIQPIGTTWMPLRHERSWHSREARCQTAATVAEVSSTPHA